MGRAFCAPGTVTTTGAFAGFVGPRPIEWDNSSQDISDVDIDSRLNDIRQKCDDKLIPRYMGLDAQNSSAKDLLRFATGRWGADILRPLGWTWMFFKCLLKLSWAMGNPPGKVRSSLLEMGRFQGFLEEEGKFPVRNSGIVEMRANGILSQDRGIDCKIA
jgi:hypothetical protein